MTPQQIETMKLALEALEGFYEYGYDRQECFEHITAIKEALAEHAMREVQRLGQEIEQEPVFTYEQVKAHIQVAMMSTTPPQRKPLTDEQLKPLIQKAMMYYGHNPEHWTVTAGAGFCILARAIEAAHGIKE